VKEMVAVWSAVPATALSVIIGALTQLEQVTDSWEDAAVNGWFVISILLNWDADPDVGVNVYVDLTLVALEAVLDSVFEYPVIAAANDWWHTARATKMQKIAFILAHY
jgi:hypothetical protein